MAYRNLHNHVRLVSIELLQLFGLLPNLNGHLATTRAARPSAKANNADNDIPVNKIHGIKNARRGNIHYIPLSSLEIDWNWVSMTDL
jgi:hypothetical protein